MKINAKLKTQNAKLKLKVQNVLNNFELYALTLRFSLCALRFGVKS